MNTVIISYDKVVGGTTRAASNKYKYSKKVDSLPTPTLLATVDRNPSVPEIVSLHSTADHPLISVSVSTFKEALDEFNTPSLWKHLHYISDPDEWLYNSICNGTTVVVHDGSYMSKMTTEASSAAVLICDKENGEWLSCVVAEKSSSADNYRGEILGGIIALLLIKAATTGRMQPGHPLHCHCDNMGVVNHALHPDWTLRENQAQADVLSLMKHIISILSTTVKYHHVQSHQLKYKTFDQLDYISQKNETCDVMAKEHLIYAFFEGDYISDNFPYEQIVFEVDNKKVTSSPTKSIHKFWSSKTARALYHNRKKIHKDHFDLIYWHGMGKVMREYPRMFRVWVTKHVSSFCGTNRQLSRIDPTVKNICPSCGQPNEPTSHINRCEDPGRVTMFTHSVTDLDDWLKSANTDPILADLIVRYVENRGEATMTELLDRYHNRNMHYKHITRYQDKLGWDNIMEGRILNVMVDHMRIHYYQVPGYQTAEWWAKNLMKKLLGITHKTVAVQKCQSSSKETRRQNGSRTREDHEES